MPKKYLEYYKILLNISDNPKSSRLLRYNEELFPSLSVLSIRVAFHDIDFATNVMGIFENDMAVMYFNAPSGIL